MSSGRSTASLVTDICHIGILGSTLYAISLREITTHTGRSVGSPANIEAPPTLLTPLCISTVTIEITLLPYTDTLRFAWSVGVGCPQRRLIISLHGVVIGSRSGLILVSLRFTFQPLPLPISSTPCLSSRLSTMSATPLGALNSPKPPHSVSKTCAKMVVATLVAGKLTS